MRCQSYRLVLLLVLVGAGLNRPALAQPTCAERFAFTPVSVPNRIEWSKFPDFSLPFPVIYAGPRFGDFSSQPLRHGFSHLDRVTNGERVCARPAAHRHLLRRGLRPKPALGNARKPVGQ